MFSTYGGAKKRAWTLQAILRETEVVVSLSQCQHALARGAGYRDWEHLRRTLDGKAPRPAELEGFLDRAALSMPTDAIGATYRWVETELGALRARDHGDSSDRRFRDWYVKDFQVVMAIGVMHRTTTALLRPGSGRGQRLRVELVVHPCLGPLYPELDRETFHLTFRGTGLEIFHKRFEHPHFQREFERLIAAGIFRWEGSLQDGGTLVLSPPTIDALRAHIQVCREGDAEHWRMNALFRAEGAAVRTAGGIDA